MSKRKRVEAEELPPHQTYEERRNLGDIRVTLDGKPARITGFRMAFAQVQGNGDSVEFAWSTVARVVQNGGSFRSGNQPEQKRRTK